MPASQQSVTSLPRSPQEDRHARMVKYTIAMSIRMVCILSCLFLQGWWLAVAAVGAVVLPYFAVILANVGGNQGTAVERPGGVVVVSARHSGFPPPAEPYVPSEPFTMSEPYAPSEPFRSSEPFTTPEPFTTYETGRAPAPRPDAARPASAAEPGVPDSPTDA